MKLVFATNNQYKLQEVQAMLPAFTILSLQDIGCYDEIEETATTLDGNAKIKADYIANKYNVSCFADDTGLEVEALNGAPGVYSARYASNENDAKKNMQKLLDNLAHTTNRAAQFRTVIALNLNKQQHFFEGVCKGLILKEKQGEKGFGYDPIFKPNGFETSFAQMTAKEKNSISHRGKAMQKLIQFLKTQQ